MATFGNIYRLAYQLHQRQREKIAFFLSFSVSDEFEVGRRNVRCYRFQQNSKLLLECPRRHTVFSWIAPPWINPLSINSLSRYQHQKHNSLPRITPVGPSCTPLVSFVDLKSLVLQRLKMNFVLPKVKRWRWKIIPPSWITPLKGWCWKNNSQWEIVTKIGYSFWGMTVGPKLHFLTKMTSWSLHKVHSQTDRLVKTVWKNSVPKLVKQSMTLLSCITVEFR